MANNRLRFTECIAAGLTIALLLLTLGYINYYLFKQRAGMLEEDSGVTVTAPVKTAVEPQTVPVTMPDDGPGSAKEMPAVSEEPVAEAPVESVVVEGSAVLDESVPYSQPVEESVDDAADEPVENVTEEASEEASEEATVSDEAESEEVLWTVVGEEADEGPVRVPASPFLFEPLVYDPDDNFQNTASKTVYDDDYFKDFYVQGQDTLLSYDDGVYYLTLYVNDEQMGSIDVQFAGEERLINSFSLEAFLDDTVTAEASEKLFADAPEYIPASYLNDRGVECTIDDVDFAVRINFSVEDMPTRIINVSGSTRNIINSYALSGAIELEPAFFSWATSYNLFLNLNSYLASDLNQFTANLSVSNYLHIGPVNLDFYYSLSYQKARGGLNFNFSSYRFFRDIINDDIRVTWGNVSTYGLSNMYQSVGIQFEKNYAYGVGTPKTNQYYQTITVTEDSELLILNEEGKELLRRNLTPGNYRIKDFLLTNGLNTITIRLTPLSAMASTASGTDAYGVKEWKIQMAYDSQLLAVGDTLYGGSLSIGRNTTDSSSLTSGPHLRIGEDKYLEYKLNDLVLSYWQDIGLTDTSTLGYEVAVASVPDGDDTKFNSLLTTSITNANALGTTSYKVIAGIGNTDPTVTDPRFAAHINHRFKLDGTAVSSLSMMIGYQNPSYNGSLTNHRYETSISFGGTLGFLRYSTNASLNFESDYGFYKPEFSTNGSISFMPFKGGSLSASISVSKPISADSFRVSGNISASFALSKKTSANISTNVVSSANANLYSRFGKDKQHYFQASLYNIRFDNPMETSIGLGYSYSNSLLGINYRSQIYNEMSNISNSLSLSTATAFADGVFTMARTVSDDYLLIKPTGSLKGSDVSVARSRDNTARSLKSRFGTALYNEVSANVRNNLVVYASGDDQFAETVSYSYQFTPYSRQAYVARITAQQSYTVTGIILGWDGVPVELFSSPVYTIVHNEDGTEEYAIDSNLYLFTDQEGRYIINGVKTGDYFIDVPAKENNKWVSVHFRVEHQDEDGDSIIEFETIDFASASPAIKAIEYDMDGLPVSGQDIPFVEYLDGSAYAAEIRQINSYTSAEFWNSIFPPFEEEEEFTYQEL